MRPPHFVFFANPLLDAWPVMAWMWLHGMFFWLVPPSTTMPSTAHVTEAYDGLRYVKTKTVRKHELKGLMPPTRIQDV